MVDYRYDGDNYVKNEGLIEELEELKVLNKHLRRRVFEIPTDT